jgi:threonine dehydrogenase-like Zn-dependent dehydrogenase
MRTIYFEKDIPKVLLTKALRPVWPGVVFSPLSPNRFKELPDGPLPGPNWIRVDNRLGGICGTDMNLFLVKADPMIAGAALPGTDRLYLGHEVISEVSEVGQGVTSLKVGDRVVMDSRVTGGPTCLSQELEQVCRHCSEGNYQLCENASLGQGPIGVGGGWGDSFTAHVSEVYRVPDEFDDETAMMVEPLSVAVRSVLAKVPGPDEQVLVVGCGMVGLNVIQSLRAIVPSCRITAMARYPQQIEMAHKLGADEVISGGDPYEAVARITSAKLYTGQLKNRMLLGGFDVVYDCVGSSKTVQDSLRWARAGGTVVMVGANLERMRVDLTPVWYKEVDLIGVLIHGMEDWNGGRRNTYDITCELLLEGKLTADGLITHYFRLEDWREAIETAQDKRSGSIKVVFDYREQAPE